MNLTLFVWRQPSGSSTGKLVRYEAPNVSPDMSFLEMLDVVNEGLISRAISRSPSITIAGRGSAAPAA